MAYIPITQEHIATMERYAPGAIARFWDFGEADRRESTFALMLAGAAPLTGLWLLGWESSAALVSLLLNLSWGLSMDLVKILWARGLSLPTRRMHLEDEAVWPVAMALSRDSFNVQSGEPASAHDVQQGRQAPVWLFSLLVYPIVAVCLLLLIGDLAVVGSGRVEIALGSLPNVLLSAGCSVFHAFTHHRDWRRAGSARLGSAGANSLLLFFVAFGTFKGLGSARQKLPPIDAMAWLACLGTLAYGAWRVHGLVRLRRAAFWLQVRMASRASTQARAPSVRVFGKP